MDAILNEQDTWADISQKLGCNDLRLSLGRNKMPTRPKLMSEERVNWYLREIDNPAFRMGLVKDGIWEVIKEKLILSLNYYKIEIPEVLK